MISTQKIPERTKERLMIIRGQNKELLLRKRNHVDKSAIREPFIENNVYFKSFGALDARRSFVAYIGTYGKNEQQSRQ